MGYFLLGGLPRNKTDGLLRCRATKPATTGAPRPPRPTEKQQARLTGKRDASREQSIASICTKDDNTGLRRLVRASYDSRGGRSSGTVLVPRSSLQETWGPHPATDCRLQFRPSPTQAMHRSETRRSLNLHKPGPNRLLPVPQCRRIQ